MKALRGQALALLTLSLLLGACSGSDPSSPSNADPAAVVLSAPADGATGLDGALTLSWDAATDPDGDAVTYTLYLDGDADPATAVASGLSGTSHTLAAALPIQSTFYWKVTADDGQGGSSTSPTRSFSTRDNAAPNAFDLLGIDDGSTGVPLAPTLSWETAVDPDGDAVLYDLYLSTATNPSAPLVAGLAGTSYPLGEPLDVETSYHWKVVARDAFGAETATALRSFTTQALISATQVTAAAPFAARSGHTSLVFDDKMWVIAGSSCCGGRYNDVWSSEDGATWAEVTANAGFPGRTVHGSAVHDGRMWVIGGNSSYSTGNEFADVWSSADGVTWQQATAAAAFGPRYGLRAASFAGKLWVFGGRDAAGSYSQSQIWSSADGATWTLETDNAAFGGTGNFQIAEFQGQLWKTGGRDDAVYRSADGVNWVLVTDSAPFGARQQHTSVAFDDKLWVLGGNNNDNVYLDLSDAWYSEDGASWVRAAADAGYEPITAHSSVVYGGRMWVIAGGGGFGSSYVSSAVYSLDY